MKNIFFRVDVSSEIGTGHLMRCLTLADALTGSVGNIRFLCRHITKPFHEMLIKRGYSVSILSSSNQMTSDADLMHSKWLGVPQTYDADQVIKALTDLSWAWGVVDHYGIDNRWESKVSEIGAKILVIDDLADRNHKCDIFLNQNIVDDSDKKYKSKLQKNTIKLIGAKYALLRDEFIAARKKYKNKIDTKVRTIFIFFGGADYENVTQKTLDAIPLVGDPLLKVVVVIGVAHPEIDTIRNNCISAGYEFYLQTDNMAELMLNADIAIGAAGTSSWERCAVGLPVLIISLAENQVSIACSLSDMGAAVYLGSSKDVSCLIIADAIKDILSNRDLYKRMSKIAYSMIDGSGKQRVVKAMDL